MKKVAFFRQTNPLGLGFAVRAVSKPKRMIFATRGHRAGRVIEAVSCPSITPLDKRRFGDPVERLIGWLVSNAAPAARTTAFAPFKLFDRNTSKFPNPASAHED